MIESQRLLGFAFAGADVVFEIDREGMVRFVAGASSGYFNHAEILGRPVRNLFEPGEQSAFEQEWTKLAPGQRVGPLPMTLSTGVKVTLSMYHLPPNDRISCALGRPSDDGLTRTQSVDSETGLSDLETFLAAASRQDGEQGAIALVDVPELPEVCSRLAPNDATKLMSRIGTTVKSIGTGASARLSSTAFGVLSNVPNAAKALSGAIADEARRNGLGTMIVRDLEVGNENSGLTSEQNLLALRHIVGRFAEGKLSGQTHADVAETFDLMMNETVQRVAAFNRTVAEKAFELVFEPIVDLATGKTHHHEALARFRSGESPADTIRFAEEMGLSDAFDLAVISKAASILEQDAAIEASIAVNVSARSFWNPASFAILSGLLMKKRPLAKRIAIEITESERVDDLGEAEKNIQQLRRMGYRVGIDDFGAGAASLQYLHSFTVDFVKVDGSVVQRLGKSTREDALLRCVLACCADLDIETVAEWIDGPDVLQRCAAIGFKFGQGRHFGGPLKELPRAISVTTRRGRRVGERVTWG